MRIFDAATAAHLSARAGIVAHQLIYISARNKVSGLVENLGIWTGDEPLSLLVEGVTRSYEGAGQVLEVEPLTAGTGLAVRTHRLQLSAASPEVEDLVKGYDTRFAPVEIHRVLFDPLTRAQIGTPHRQFRGVINGLEFPTERAGGEAACVVELVSETRILTRGLATKKSDASHQARGGDRFRRYGDISGAVPVYWGEMRLESAAPPAPVSLGGFSGRRNDPR